MVRKTWPAYRDAASMAMLMRFLLGSASADESITPCSLAKAMALPVNVRAPIQSPNTAVTWAGRGGR